MLDFSKKKMRVRNRCGTSENAMEIFNIFGSGDFGAYLFQSCALLFVNVSSVCLGKGFAPLRCTCTVKLLRGCGWAMAAVRLWNRC